MTAATSSDCPDSERSYSNQLRTFFDEFLPDGAYVAAEVAHEAAKHLLAHQYDLINGWFVENLPALLTDYLNRSRRQQLKVALSPRTRAFVEARTKHDAHVEEQRQGLPAGSLGGDPQALSLFARSIAVNADNLLKPFGQMTRVDVLWVADGYRARSKQNLLLEAFYRAVGAKVPDDGVSTVADVMSEDEVRRLRQSIIAR
jgi:hypothetical protein